MSAVSCPYCSEVLVDPQLERCPTCGMFVLPETQAILRAQLESQHRSSSQKSVHRDQPSVASSSTQSAQQVDGEQEIPIAFSPGQADPENPQGGRRWDSNVYGLEIAGMSSQVHLAVLRRIFLHSGIGLAIWSLATLSLGKWGLLPLAAFPASLSIFLCLLSLGSPNRRDWGLAAAAAGTAMFAMAIAIVF